MQVGDKGPDVRTTSSDVRYAFRCLFGEDCDWEGLQLKPYHWINEL